MPANQRLLAAFLFFLHEHLLFYFSFSISDLLGLFLLELDPLCFLRFVETIKLLDIGVVDDLGDVELAQHFLLLFLEGFLYKLVVAVLDAPLLVDLLDCTVEEETRMLANNFLKVIVYLL